MTSLVGPEGYRAGMGRARELVRGLEVLLAAVVVFAFGAVIDKGWVMAVAAGIGAIGVGVAFGRRAGQQRRVP